MSEHPTTDNHDFARPEEDSLEDEWGTVINEELTDLLEERVAIVDEASELGNYTPYADAVFIGTYNDRDAIRLYVGTGSSWNAVAFGDDGDRVPSTSFFNTTDTLSAHVDDQLDIPVYADDENAPNETVFFDSSDNSLKYKDDAGNVFSGDGGGDGFWAESDGILEPTTEDEAISVKELNAADISDVQEPDQALITSGDGDLLAQQVDDAAIDMASVVVEDPQPLPLAELSDGESIEIGVVVDDGETLEVYRWGAYDVFDGTAPTGLDVELLDGDDTVQASANTVNDQDKTTPVASQENTSGSQSVFKLRAKNDSGNAIEDPGVGAHFGYVVV